MKEKDIFGLTKHSYSGIDSLFTYQYVHYNRDVMTGECVCSKLVDDEMVETRISEQEFQDTLEKCKAVFDKPQVPTPQTYITADGKVVFHAIIDSEVVELISIDKMLNLKGIEYVVIDGIEYRDTFSVFDALTEKYAEMQKQEEKSRGSKINLSELQELIEHMVRRATSMEIPTIYLRCLTFKDISAQFLREFDLICIEDLRNRYLCEAHEFIDCYELPLYLREQVELEKAGREHESGQAGV